VVLFRPAGNETTSIGAASGTAAEMAVEILGRAEALGIEARRADGGSLPLGPFGPQKIWRDSQQTAVISPGVQYAGTPAEVVDRAELERIARLLAEFLGVTWRERPAARPQVRARGRSRVLRLHP
jgi:hypothetical protein